MARVCVLAGGIKHLTQSLAGIPVVFAQPFSLDFLVLLVDVFSSKHRGLPAPPADSNQERHRNLQSDSQRAR